MKPRKVEDNEIYKAIEAGEKYIQVGERKYLLMEVEEIKNPKEYIVDDPDEEKQIIDALSKDNPLVSEAEIMKLLREKL